MNIELYYLLEYINELGCPHTIKQFEEKELTQAKMYYQILTHALACIGIKSTKFVLNMRAKVVQYDMPVDETDRFIITILPEKERKE